MVGLKAGRTSFQASLTFVRVDRVLTILALVGAPQRKVYGADTDRVARVAAERMTRGPRAGAWFAACRSPGPLHPGTGTCPQRAARGPATSSPSPTSGNAARRTRSRSSAAWSSPGATSATLRRDARRPRLPPASRGHGAKPPRQSVFAHSETDQRRSPGRPGAPVAIDATGNRRPRPDRVDGDVPTPGVWTGSPAEFEYQWRRCNEFTDVCLDVVGATGPAYVVEPADSGRRLRVLVVGTNDAGAGGALSPPSAIGSLTALEPPDHGEAELRRRAPSIMCDRT